MSSTNRRAIALLDCNNFFASSEQLFNPAWRGKALIVLSSNDGIVIARSKEAKKLGIPMGAPIFKYKDLLRQNNVISVSSNFSLYGEMSSRVVQTLESFGFPIEVYSIDESFIHLPNLSQSQIEELATEIRARVQLWTGIPCAIGVSTTHTLAKLENERAKKEGGISVATEEDKIAAHLEKCHVGDVWGIGTRSSAHLRSQLIFTAADLIRCNDSWIRSHFSVGMLRTVFELRGVPSEAAPDVEGLPGSICSSRSFGKDVTTLAELKSALATFTAKAAEKLRQNSGTVSFLSIFLNPKDRDSLHASMTIPTPTSYTPTLISYVEAALKTCFREGLTYKKAGVILSGIGSIAAVQLDLLAEKPSPKPTAAMEALDSINSRYGKRSLFFGAEGIEQAWKSKSGFRTPAYLTSWDELPTVGD